MSVVCTMAGMGTVAIFLVRDTERSDAVLQELLERQAYLANHDPLTALANRAAVTTHLEALNPIADRVHIFMVDLDGFKQINDQFGHACGDEVLVLIAERLQSFAKKSPPGSTARR